MDLKRAWRDAREAQPVLASLMQKVQGIRGHITYTEYGDIEATGFKVIGNYFRLIEAAGEFQVALDKFEALVSEARIEKETGHGLDYGRNDG